MLHIGQLIYKQNKKDGQMYYDLGIVTNIFDNRYFMKLKYKKHITSGRIEDLKDNLENEEEGNVALTINGKPAIARKNIFGKYTFN